MNSRVDKKHETVRCSQGLDALSILYGKRGRNQSEVETDCILFTRVEVVLV